jgi:hypothetical protein
MEIEKHPLKATPSMLADRRMTEGLAPHHSLKNTLATVDHTSLYVIAVCTNPIRYQSRYRLFHTFKKHMEDQGAKVITVEIGFRERHFIVTNRDNPYDLQLRSKDELWLKEAAINRGIQYLTNLDPDWKYVAWIDGDINFVREDVVFETVQQLQHFPVVQMFSHAMDLGPSYEPQKVHNGFVWSYWNNEHQPPKGPGHGGYYTDQKGFWHPGYAWAARRDFFDRTILLDKAILGAGDHHMAMALIGQSWRSYPKGVHESYKRMVHDWQDIVEAHVKRNIGYVPGMITHNWHGKKTNRKYIERWEILVNDKYDWRTDLTTDMQGLYRLAQHKGHRQIKLRQDIQRYFRQRNEDGIDSD